MTDQEILSAVDAGESLDWEFKSARGGFPANVWETYSAMANADGGTIVLGVGEADGLFAVEGLEKPKQMLKTCWDTANNPGKVSANLFSNDDVRVVVVGDRPVLVMRVPRAGRFQRPVFVGQNPLDGTYRRSYEGDYKCQRDEVGRMLADQSSEPADGRVLGGFGAGDLDAESLRQYRNRFSARNPSHPWLGEDTTGFLCKLGGWARDRGDRPGGLTVAGLLMFGNEDALGASSSGLKHHLDYRERTSDAIADRWADRVTIDGTWVPNLHSFFQRVYPKLTADLKLPFAYQATPTTPAPDRPADPVRAGQSPAHEAVQEALVNALIHADYQGSGGVVIERFTTRLELSNPGTLLVSYEQLRQGGVSECRNPSLQKMFQMIGAGDKAGSGVDKIRRGWETQHWGSPSVFEVSQPDRVVLVLPMVSLLPAESESRLRDLLGDDYDTLTPVEVQTLVTADVEREVSNSRLQLMRTEHPVELTKMLQSLTARGFLEQSGQGRRTVYRLPTWPALSLPGASHLPPGASHLPPGASHLPPGASHLPPGASHHPAVVGSDEERLRQIAAPAREKKKLAAGLMRQIVLQLCEGRYLTTDTIARLVERSKQKLQESLLSQMVEDGVLALKFPDQPTRPDQAYTTKGQ